MASEKQMEDVYSGQVRAYGSKLLGVDSDGQAQSDEEYAELKRLIEEKGLMDRRPVFYIYKITFTLGLLAASLSLILILDNLWLHLLNAALLGFAFGQTASIAHDAGHNQIFNSTKRNNVVGLVVRFLVAVSKSWWADQHGMHHRYTNDIDLDPHNVLPIVAFSEEQASRTTGFLRGLIRYQAVYYVPLLFFESYGMRVISVRFLLSERTLGYRLELLMMVVHFAMYFTALSFVFGVWQMFLFVVVHQGVFGFYSASIFAPNHKGMPVNDEDTRRDFLRSQVTSSRNLKGNSLVDFWYVGLNFQIEHHLFPSMPRNKLREARIVVREFCMARSISYYKTGVLQSIKDILQFLNQVGASRGTKPTGPVIQ